MKFVLSRGDEFVARSRVQRSKGQMPPANSDFAREHQKFSRANFASTHIYATVTLQQFNDGIAYIYIHPRVPGMTE